MLWNIYSRFVAIYHLHSLNMTEKRHWVGGRSKLTTNVSIFALKVSRISVFTVGYFKLRNDLKVDFRIN